jgi:hypothetical protein
VICDDAHFHAAFAHAAVNLGAAPLWIEQAQDGGVTGVLAIA